MNCLAIDRRTPHRDPTHQAPNASLVARIAALAASATVTLAIFSVVCDFALSQAAQDRMQLMASASLIVQ